MEAVVWAKVKTATAAVAVAGATVEAAMASEEAELVDPPVASTGEGSWAVVGPAVVGTEVVGRASAATVTVVVEEVALGAV